jgi:uridine kinase
VLVGIDGPDAAGKTMLADALAAALPGAVHRVSVDDFPRPSEERYRRGELSPEGLYRDSTDLPRLVEGCLVPFRDGVAGTGPAVLVVDGVFVLRPELRPFWHLSVYLRVPEEVRLARALVRDLALYDSAADVEHRYRARYLPGQALYRARPIRSGPPTSWRTTGTRQRPRCCAGVAAEDPWRGARRVPDTGAGPARPGRGRHLVAMSPGTVYQTAGIRGELSRHPDLSAAPAARWTLAGNPG